MTDALALRDALIVDGTGAPPARGDVLVRGGRIAAVGDVGAAPGAREVRLGGLALAPGFIDAHTHDDQALLHRPDMTAKVSQGVTTVVVGNCGVSLAPLVTDRPPAPLDLIDTGGAYRFGRMRDYMAALDAAPPAVNAVPFVGHMSLRVRTMDRLDREATAAERAAMRALLEAALDDGAFGLSTGLEYPPSRAATTEEVIDVARPLGPRGGIYATHMRDEGPDVLRSLEETFRVGREVGAPVVVSHHKVVGRANFGRSAETLPALLAAMGRQRVALDAYPYAASSTMLDAERVRRADRVLVAWSKAHPELAGLDLREAAARLSCTPEEAVPRLLPAGAVYFSMSEDDVRAILAFPETMVGSDGLPHDVHPHPRLWGTFPRVLGRYSREEGLFPLELAVRKMTGLTAERFGLADRGRIAVGMAADLCAFDPATVIDTATFDSPTSPALGIRLVVCNGVVAWDDGPTGARAGRALRRGA